MPDVCHNPHADDPKPCDECGYDPREDDQEPDCIYCRGSGLSPYSIRDVPCRHCGGRG